MSKTTKVIIGAIIVLLILIGGCNMLTRKAGEFMAEKMIEDASGGKAKVDMNDGSMTVTTSEGTFTTNGGKVPDNWPSDVPVYPGSTVQFSGEGTMEAANGMALVLMSKDSADTITDFYTAKLTAAGWTAGTKLAGQGSTVMIMTKGAEALSLTITKAEGMTTITMGYQEKSE